MPAPTKSIGQIPEHGGILQDWPAIPGVRALFTTRAGGHSAAPWSSLNLGEHVGDHPPHVSANRARLLQWLQPTPASHEQGAAHPCANTAALAPPPQPAAPPAVQAIFLHQIHGCDVFNADAAAQPIPGAEAITAHAAAPAFDASITTRPGLACVILVADCLPVLLAHDSGQCVGAAHAGWRGLAGAVAPLPPPAAPGPHIANSPPLPPAPPPHPSSPAPAAAKGRSTAEIHSAPAAAPRPGPAQPLASCAAIPAKLESHLGTEPRPPSLTQATLPPTAPPPGPRPEGQLTAAPGVIEQLWHAYALACWQRLHPHEAAAHPADQPLPAAVRQRIARHTRAWLGPCIGPTAFEVGEDVRQAFVQADPQAARHFHAAPPTPASNAAPKWLVDLAALARERLRALGITHIAGNDSSAAWCTHSNPERYFSHRRDATRLGSTGRMAAAIWIEPRA